MLLTSTRRWFEVVAAQRWHVFRCKRRELLALLVCLVCAFAVVLGIVSATQYELGESFDGCSSIVTVEEPLNITSRDGAVHTIPPLPVCPHIQKHS